MNYFQSTFLIAFLLMLAPGVQSQDTASRPEIPVDEVSKLITYKQVIQQNGTADELYVRGIAWLNTFYKNPADVTRTRDRVNGLIKGVSRFKLFYTDKEGFKREAGLCEYDFVIEFKEGRYRYTFTNFTLKELSRQPMEKFLNRKDPAYNPQWDNYLLQADAFVKETVTSLEKAMEPPVIRDDSW